MTSEAGGYRLVSYQLITNIELRNFGDESISYCGSLGRCKYWAVQVKHPTRRSNESQLEDELLEKNECLETERGHP